MKKVQILLLALVFIFGVLNITENYLYWIHSSSRLPVEIINNVVFKYFLIPTLVVYLYKDLQLKKGI